MHTTTAVRPLPGWPPLRPQLQCATDDQMACFEAMKTAKGNRLVLAEVVPDDENRMHLAYFTKAGFLAGQTYDVRGRLLHTNYYRQTGETCYEYLFTKTP